MPRDRAVRVLVVDDDDDLRTLVATLLEAEGYVVDVAEDGLAALDAVQRAMPDVILLDMKMPRMDGWAFARELRKRFGRHAKLVVFTAADDARRRGLEVSADAVIGKPFDVDALLRVVDACSLRVAG